MEMKTLTVNGKTYIVADPDAAHFDNSKPGDGAWSGKNTVDQLCPTFTESGSVVSCHPVEGYPLDVVSRIEPVQEGEGDPSPENIRPITGHTKVKLRQRYGKNHIPTDVTNADSWQVADNHAYYKAYYLPELTKGSKYTFSVAANTEGVSNYLYLQKYLNNTWITMSFVWAGNAAYKAFTFTAEGTAYRLWISNPNVVPNIAYAQLEEGAVATPYEPYHRNEYIIDLGQEVYGGALNWATGELMIDRYTEVLDGVNKKFQSVGTTNEYVYGMYMVENSANGSLSISSHLKPSGDAIAYGTQHMGSVNMDGHFAYIQAFADVDEANAWLVEQTNNGTPYTFTYPLKEPITVQLTPQEILALSGMNTIYSDTGDTQVSGKADLRVTIEKMTNAIIALGGKV